MAKIELTEDDYRSIIDELITLYRERGKSYNTSGISVHDYFPLGRMSYFQMLWVKMLRTMAGVKEDREIDDSLLDLINYAIFFLDYERKQQRRKDNGHAS